MIISKGTKCYIKNTLPSGDGLTGRTTPRREGRIWTTWTSQCGVLFFFLVFFERVVALHNMEDLTASPLILAPQCPSQVLTCSLCYARGKPQLQDHVPSRWAQGITLSDCPGCRWVTTLPLFFTSQFPVQIVLLMGTWTSPDRAPAILREFVMMDSKLPI